MTSSRIRRWAASFLADESGATAIEYALIAGGIFVVIAAVVYETGTALQEPYQAVADGLGN